jgi:hypothetical protein
MNATTLTKPTAQKVTAEKASVSPSELDNAVAYRGDDWAQNMARQMQVPLLAMGLMAVAGGLVAGVVAGINFGDFFSPSGVASDLGRAEAAVQITGSILFLGIGLILAGITMTLVNVVRTLRDAGRDVQTALGAAPVQLAKPRTGKLTPPVMMLGVMIEVAALVIGLFAALTIGGVDPTAIADPSTASGADIGDIGFVRAANAWLPALRMVGIATILGSVVLTLATIRSAIRFQGDRISELATAA